MIHLLWLTFRWDSDHRIPNILIVGILSAELAAEFEFANLTFFVIACEGTNSVARARVHRRLARENRHSENLYIETL